jgi:antitoxin (DNA-binding transcriptional repressor) of toxin-antitoxin stability system
MTTVAINDALSRFNELLHRSHLGEVFVVVEGNMPLACLGPVPATEVAEAKRNFFSKAHALRSRLRADATPIADDIAEGQM